MNQPQQYSELCLSFRSLIFLPSQPKQLLIIKLSRGKGPWQEVYLARTQSLFIVFHTEQTVTSVPSTVRGKKNGFCRARVENKGKETTYLHIPNQANAQSVYGERRQRGFELRGRSKACFQFLYHKLISTGPLASWVSRLRGKSHQ